MEWNIETISFILFIAIIGLMIMTFVIQSRFRKINLNFSSISNSHGKTGAEVAREILRRNNISNVQVIISSREGTDHYNPRTNQIMLSPSVYNSKSISAAAIAAHEVGHAIQWGKQEVGIKFRDSLAKPVGIISQIGNSIMSMGFFFLIISFSSSADSIYGAWFLMGGVMAYGATTLFHFATLPVEFGASRKAKKQLDELGYLKSNDEVEGTKKVLNAAAMTYVIAALTSLAMLLLFILKILARRRN